MFYIFFFFTIQICKGSYKNGYCDKVSKSTGKVLRLKSAYVEDMKQLDISSQIKMITANTHVIVGSKDNEGHL